MKPKVCGLMNIGRIMRPVDKWIVQHVQMSDAETVALVGPSDHRNVYKELVDMEWLSVNMYDYDPQRAGNDMVTVDVVFDIELKEDLIINFACEKMWPLGNIYKGREFILIGDNEHHNGDCNPINSNKDLIKQNELTEVWSFNQIKRWGNTKHFMVYGCN